MVVVQYPHFLFVQELGGDSYQDDEGNWVTEEPFWVFHSKCREETNGRASYINTRGGVHTMFSSLIQIPRGSNPIPEGRNVIISNVNSYTEEIRIKGSILKFDYGQLHNRLWV